MRGRIAGLCVIAGCGRFGYDPRSDAAVTTPDALADAAHDARLDAPIDTAIDAYIPVCPTGTTELTAGSDTCIELTEHGTDTWTNAKAICEGQGRRLCADAEWFLGCTNATGIIDMTDLGWEWVAEEASGVAAKRGDDLCTSMSSHVITDPYEYRCCVGKS
jgi:hypothetical protein